MRLNALQMRVCVSVREYVCVSVCEHILCFSCLLSTAAFVDRGWGTASKPAAFQTKTFENCCLRTSVKSFVGIFKPCLMHNINI